MKPISPLFLYHSKRIAIFATYNTAFIFKPPRKMPSPNINISHSASDSGTRYARPASAGETSTAELHHALAALRVIDAGYFGMLHGEWSSDNDKESADGYVMIYCTGGYAEYSVNGNTSVATPHKVIIHEARDKASYTIQPGKSWSIYRIRFSGTMARALTEKNVSREFFSPGDLLGAEIASRLEEILASLERETDIESQIYCSGLLHYIIGTLRRSTTMTVRNTPDNSDEMVDMAIRYMKDNLSKKLSLQDFTEMTTYSKPHFMMIFKRATGHSPMSYFNMLKIMKACSLLDTTDLKINQICFAIGINDMFYFSRLFKKHMHLSPSEYRCRHNRGASINEGT